MSFQHLRMSIYEQDIICFFQTELKHNIVIVIPFIKYAQHIDDCHNIYGENFGVVRCIGVLLSSKTCGGVVLC